MKKIRRSLIGALIVSLLPAATWAGPVNVNTADATTLAKELDGVGMAKATAIVEYREQYGAFESADDLLKVKGIGRSVLDQNRGNILVDGSTQKKSGSKASN